MWNHSHSSGSTRTVCEFFTEEQVPSCHLAQGRLCVHRPSNAVVLFSVYTLWCRDLLICYPKVLHPTVLLRMPQPPC